LVRRIRHRRGWIGELLKSRAVRRFSWIVGGTRLLHQAWLTFLEDLGSVHLDQAQVGIFVLLPVTHLGRLGRRRSGNSWPWSRCWILAVSPDNHHVALTPQGWRDGVSRDSLQCPPVPCPTMPKTRLRGSLLSSHMRFSFLNGQIILTYDIHE
jgi:hypothetical protein